MTVKITRNMLLVYDLIEGKTLDECARSYGISKPACAGIVLSVLRRMIKHGLFTDAKYAKFKRNIPPKTWQKRLLTIENEFKSFFIAVSKDVQNYYTFGGN